MNEVSQQHAFQQEVSNVETTIAALEAHRDILGDLVADTALDLLRERLATLIQPDQAPDERKRVTVLFADVSGYTALSENLDPEDVASIMNRLFEAVTVEIHRYGGTIDKYSGDAVMALFGAPLAQENHEEMAVRAALAMQRVIAAFSRQLEQERGFRLQMRIGLNTGEVLAGLVGGLKTRSYTVMGDTVNLAARLESAAPVGGILASEATARRLKAIFDFADPEKISVKGKSADITVYRVRGEKSERGRVRGLAGLYSPMVGRETEFMALQNSFNQVITNSEWQATAVTGDAGLGKSRLQHELVNWITHHHPHTCILTGRCFSHTRTTPYYLIAGLMRSLFKLGSESQTETAVSTIHHSLQTLQPDAAESELQYQLGSLAGVLGFTLPDNPLQNLEPEQRRDRTFLSLERIFAAAAGQAPLLALVDDLHWADALSLDFLDRLLQMSSRQELSGAAMLLILSRPAENPQSHLGQLLARLEQPPHHTLTLQALDERHSCALIENLLGQEMPADLRNLITDHAQGNPFYVEEVLRSLIEDGTLQKNGAWRMTQHVDDVRIPSSVQDILAARIDRLPPEDKRVTQHAAIIGRIFWQQVLGEITRAKTVEPTLLLLELRQLADRIEQSQIAQEWEWVFHHGLIQEVAYSMVPKATRCVVHRQIAQLLEEYLGDQTTFLLPLIAYHYEKGDIPDKAIEYLGRAGELAASQFANEDAISYFSRALNLLAAIEGESELTNSQREQQYTLLMGRTEVYHLTAQREGQAADLQQLKTLTAAIDEPWRCAEVSLRYASYYDALSDFPGAVSAAREALSWAEQAANATQKVEALNAWALGLIRQGIFEEARKLAQEAQILARKNQNLLGETVSLAHLGIVHYFLDDFEGARDSLEHSLQLAQTLSDLHRQTSCLTNLVGIYHGLGDFAQGKRCCEDALEIARIMGDRSKEVTIVNNLGGMYHALGDLTQARDHHEKALRLSQMLNNRMGESMAANNLALVLHDLGNDELACQYAEHALAIDREIGDRRGEGYSLTALALALEGLGELSAAANAHQEAFALRQGIGQKACAIDNLAGLASVALKQEKLNTAVKHTEEALNWIAEHGVSGIEYPLRVYLTSADVFQAIHQEGKSRTILEAAQALLTEQAERISEQSARHAFLENVPLHQQVRYRLAKITH